MKKYQSKYSNGKEVTAAQYITEMVCENRAKMLKKDLHYRFWLSSEWSKYYRNQIGSANQLLEKFLDVAIIRALKSQEASRIYSLRAPHLLPMIEREQKILESQNQILSLEIERKPSPSFAQKQLNINKSILSKLKDIDNDS